MNADRIYTPQGMGIDYNGSDDGWVMVYDWTTGQANYGLRAAFSVFRPTFSLGKSVGTYVRTDGYYSRDCGWWYTVKGADVNYVRIYYPSTYGGGLITTMSGTTDDMGVWRNETALYLTHDMPMGTYKVTANVTGNSRTLDSSNMTVYFDVGGELFLTVNTNASTTDSNGHPKGNKGEVIKVYGKVLQPNGDEFNTTIIPAASAATVKIGVSEPNTSYEYFTNTTSDGDYSVNVPLDQLGRYSVVVSGNATVGGSGGIRYERCEGRNETFIISTGEWPENSFALSPFLLILTGVITAVAIYYQGGMSYRR